MQVELSRSVDTTVSEHLISEIGTANIDSIKNILAPFIKGEKLLNIHTSSDLFEYFKFSDLNDLIIIQTIKQLLGKLNREDLIQYVEAYEFLLRTLVGISGAESFYNVYKEIMSRTEVVIGHNDATTLKEEYKEIIDSVRTLYSIQNVRELLSILEDRDAVNNYDVTILENILEKFREESLKKLVISYKILLGSSTCCEICKCETSNAQNIQHLKPEYDELEDALTYLYVNLGPKWKKLARALKLNDATISSIRTDYISDTEEQIIQMFNCWRQTGKDVSLASLLSALRSRICNFMYLANEIEKKTYRNF